MSCDVIVMGKARVVKYLFSPAQTLTSSSLISQVFKMTQYFPLFELRRLPAQAALLRIAQPYIGFLLVADTFASLA
jgi:hypothetical protein